MSDAIGDRPGRIVVVEDDEALAVAIGKVLENVGHGVEIAGCGAELEGYLAHQIPEVILLDLNLPDRDGMDLLPMVKEMDEDISVIVITGKQDVGTVVEAMKRGADHFLAKPFALEELNAEVTKVLAQHRLRRRLAVYSERVSSPSAGEVLPDLVGTSKPIKAVRDLVAQVAETDASVVLLGETGTGKGMIARGIHHLSRRASGAFVEINCASVQPQLLEAEIFGYEKGAFTGAVARKPGLLEISDGGTLFLDEIAEMDLQAQGKLLTAIESGSFRRVGGIKEIHVDVRVIAATHHDLEKEAASGTFRQDLFYRLNVFQIALPALRERLDDVLELAHHFIRALNPSLGRSVESLSPRTAALLASYQWPGNVRELRNVIERAMILARGPELRPEHIPPNLRAKGAGAGTVLNSMSDVEREHIEKVLSALNFNIKQAASILGISRSTLYLKMKQYDISQP
ncbi:MAG: sigma-54 dependent transcriptional regulator [Thermoanaerobaculales bacterium]|nr:sigma-54 dependent transcriptional regulator [Thermoanaerobaculales bacterium]